MVSKFGEAVFLEQSKFFYHPRIEFNRDCLAYDTVVVDSESNAESADELDIKMEYDEDKPDSKRKSGGILTWVKTQNDGIKQVANGKQRSLKSNGFTVATNKPTPRQRNLL